MADDYGLSAQDKSDLAEIRKRLPANDPRRAKIDTLIGPETAAATSTSTSTSPNSIVGGIGRRVGGILKGVGQTFFGPPQPGENIITATPAARIVRGVYQSAKQAGGQAAAQAKEAAAIPPGNKTIKALEYARALNTGLAALDPFASSTVANVNELQDEGRTREAVGEAIPDTALLALGTKPGQAVARALTPDIPGFVKGKLGKLTNTTPEHVGSFVSKVAKENATKIAQAKQAIQETSAKAAQDHLEATLDALHETRGNELQYQQAVKNAQEAAQSAQRALDAEHDTAVQDALQKTREREDLYQSELRKAKAESEDAYQKKIREFEESKAKAERDRRSELQQYIAKRAKVQSDLESVQNKFKSSTAKQAKIEPTEAKLKQAWSDLRAGVETARENALKIGNSKYSAVNQKLSPLPADMEKISDAYLEAVQSLGESQAVPTLLTRMEKALKEPLTYKDEQALYSDLNKELSKGTLPGTLYHAYDRLHDVVGDDMQRIADSRGMGQQLTDARNYWRRMKQTFGKPLNSGDVASRTLKSSASDIARSEEQANRIRLLGSFDPRITGLFSHIENLQKGLDSLPNPVPQRTLIAEMLEAKKPFPKLPTKPTPLEPPELVPPRVVTPPERIEIPSRPEQVQPKLPEPPKRVSPPDRPVATQKLKTLAPVKVVTPETIHQFKADQILGKGENLENTSNRMATIFTGLDAIRNIFKRNPQGIAIDLAARGSFGAAQNAIGKLLENPKFVNALSNLTPADIDQIMRLPADQRAGFDQIVQQARKQGVKVDPAVVSALAAATPRQKPVAAALAGAR